MGALEDLQMELASEKPIGSIILKLRLFTAKLGSNELETWVKHELEGYPQGDEVPDYRKLGMSFVGQFSGAFGSGIRNAPIPPHLIGQIAGENWKTHTMRYSAASIDTLIGEGEGLSLDLSDLALLIQGKVYEDMACNQLVGYISNVSIVEVANAIRSRLLDLTIEIERNIPEAAGVSISAVPETPEVATQIFNQTILGGMTNVQSLGDNAIIQIVVTQGSLGSLRDAFSGAGFSLSDATELAKIISEQETPVKNQPLGEKARKWLAERVTKGVDAGVGSGIGTLVNLAEEAARQFFGQI